jgi:hypothetical protein
MRLAYIFNSGGSYDCFQKLTVMPEYKYFVAAEMEELAKHGTLLPPNIMGLTDEQVEELKLVDEWGEKCVPSGGCNFNKDPVGRRNGKQPNEHMQDVIKRTSEEAKAMMSKVNQLMSWNVIAMGHSWSI